MTKLLGINTALNHLTDKDKMVTFHKALNPAWSVAMVDGHNDIKLINAFAADNPNTNIIGRVYYKQDGGMHIKPTGKGDEQKEFTVSPQDWLAWMCEFDDRVWAYVMNEPKGNASDVDGYVALDKLSKWMILYTDGAILKKRKSVLWNWGDREPAIENGMWNIRWHGTLKKIALYPDLFRIGMHFYGPDDMTEHLKAYLKTCEYLGIPPIKVIGTEFGVDTNDGSRVNGPWSRDMSDAKYADWIENVINDDAALAPYIKSGVLEGLCVFAWNNQERWKVFDVTNHTEWQQRMLDSKKITKEVHAVQLNIPFPADFATRSKERYVKSIGVSQGVRSQPNRNDKDLKSIILGEGQRCDVILPEDLKPDEIIRDSFVIGGKTLTGVWLPIQVNSKQGWIFSALVTIEEIKETSVTGENPVVPAVPNTELTLDTVSEAKPVTLPPPPPETKDFSIKKFTLQTTFVGTDEELAKALEGINLFMRNIWTVEKVEKAGVPALP